MIPPPSLPTFQPLLELDEGLLLDIEETYEDFLNDSEGRLQDPNMDVGGLSPPRGTNPLVQALYVRLEHLVLNVTDYPPAQIFVRYVHIYYLYVCMSVFISQVNISSNGWYLRFSRIQFPRIVILGIFKHRIIHYILVHRN